ncbi:Ca2+-binding EF-hand superfamily protein [Crossiella equi]|uniref:Ca2+-binding EF-hand superfamily protein n=1 Tax=Crossiella equi TaxID=130796 RepID=A0ABS5A5U6_9PSEU|nr:EF-hand domain-containing protein [Crossiella equi]MBP2471579.1 Ca2+-binding EF-hand superfamily protein [Crossiella equi]
MSDAEEPDVVDASFDLCDVDGDGQLEWEDLRDITEISLRRLGIGLDSHQGQTVLTAWAGWWGCLLEYADTNGDGQLDRAEFRQAVSTGYQAEPRYLNAVNALSAALFGAVDADADGYLSYEEVIGIETTSEIPKRQAMASFHAMDLDRDGRISRQEYEQAFRSMCLGEDPLGAANLLLG